MELLAELDGGFEQLLEAEVITALNAPWLRGSGGLLVLDDEEFDLNSAGRISRITDHFTTGRGAFLMVENDDEAFMIHPGAKKSWRRWSSGRPVPGCAEPAASPAAPAQRPGRNGQDAAADGRASRRAWRRCRR